jgi:hypothetical protein
MAELLTGGEGVFSESSLPVTLSGGRLTENTAVEILAVKVIEIGPFRSKSAARY